MQSTEVLQIVGGQVLLPLLIILILAPNLVIRHQLFLNLTLCFVFYSIIFSLSTYVKHRTDTLSLSVCYAQAALVHGTVPMVSVANLFMVLQLWKGIRHPTFTSKIRPVILAFMLISPYVVLLLFAIPVFVEVAHHPENIIQTSPGSANYFCSVNDSEQTHIPLYFGAFSIVLMAIPIGDVLRIVFSRWNLYQVDRRLFSSFIRTIIFAAYELLGVVLCIIFIQGDKIGKAVYALQASFPLALFLVFGSSRDIYYTVCFWTKQDVSIFVEKRYLNRRLGKRSPETPFSSTTTLQGP